MTIAVSPDESTAQAALRSFLLGILPAGIEVVRGQVNRVASPKGPDYVVFWPLRRGRLSTNVDEFVDTRFTASIAADTMTVSAVDYGALQEGSVVFGVDVATPTTVTSQVSGTEGGVGTYKVSPSQNISARVMAAGVLNATQSTELTFQLDVHGPAGGDNAQRICTMLRDDYAVQAFEALGFQGAPLTAENRGQIPFVNSESQYEDRWVVEACIQANVTVEDIPQQFFEEVVVGLKEVDTSYPP